MNPTEPAPLRTPRHPRIRKWLRRGLWTAAGALLLFTATGVYHTWKPLPPGVSFAGPVQPAGTVRFLRDLTFLDEHGIRQVDQEIFDAVFQMIDEAQEFILVDMFLFNDFQGARPEDTRKLCDELTDHLVARKQAVPGIEILFITDPINTVYGGLETPQLERLRAAGIPVTFTDLTKLRDSNPACSSVWRWLVRPFGNSNGGIFPNPFGEGHVGLRSYLALLNFKANHRKVVIADGPAGLTGLVTSANPHDGSSAHENVAVQFTGPAAADLLRAEAAVLAFSGGPEIRFKPDPSPVLADEKELAVQLVTERQIKNAALRLINPGDSSGSVQYTVDLVMFYFSDRDLVDAIRHAAESGARVRLILDPNKDAFGHQKGGIPNRQVAAEFAEIPGITIRWADTHGEQCHSKMLLVDDGRGQSSLLLGSANYTRRNLDDFNLELDALVEGDAEAAVFQDARTYFDQAWNNADGKVFTTDYESYRDESRLKRWRYRFMEATGLSTF